MLTESNIQRFSRQILLAEVGGRGQVALLSQRFWLRGQGPGLETAAAYLAGAGCELLLSDARPVAPDEVGYLLGAADVGAPLEDGLAAALPVLERPASGPPGPGELGEVPARFTSGGPRVALGRWKGAEGEEGIAWASAGACGDCFDAAVGRLTGGLGGAGSVRAGSVAALMAERVVLGLDHGVGLLRLSARGPLAEEPDRCARCR